MKTALCTIAFQERPVEEALDLARQSGLHGVEIWGKEPHMGPEYDADRTARLRRAIEERGLSVAAFGSYVKPEMEDFPRLSQAALRIAAGLGAKVVRIWAGGGPSKTARPEAYAFAAEKIRDMCDRARGLGLTLAFEFHDNSLCDTARSALRLLEEVDRPNLKTYFQPSRRPDADDPYEAAEALAGSVVNVHAQNWTSDAARAPIGRGAVDYARVAQILRRGGFDGYLEIEFLREEDKLAALAEDAAFLNSLVASFG